MSLSCCVEGSGTADGSSEKGRQGSDRHNDPLEQAREMVAVDRIEGRMTAGFETWFLGRRTAVSIEDAE